MRAISLDLPLFAPVMATAIVALGTREHLGHGPVATAAAVVAGLLYATTLLAFLRRRTVPGTPTALSFVAGTGALAAVAPSRAAALLTVAALVAWVAVAARKHLLPPRTRGGALAGGALLATVATQAVVIAGSTQLARLGGPVARWLVVGGGGALWLLGLALYAVLIPAVVRGRGTHGAALPAGDDWIAMGALAISALAAATLHEALRRLHAPHVLATVAAGGAAACWAGAGAWIVPLVWREHGWLGGRVRLRYGFDRWSTVFPLGMYAACGVALARALDRPQPLLTISAFAFALAALAWLGTTAGAVRRALQPKGPRINKRSI